MVFYLTPRCPNPVGKLTSHPYRQRGPHTLQLLWRALVQAKMMLKINSLTGNCLIRTLVMGSNRPYGTKKIARAVMYSAHYDLRPSAFALSMLVCPRTPARVRRARLVWGTFWIPSISDVLLAALAVVAQMDVQISRNN